MKWQLEEGGTLGQGGEYNPTLYPRSNLNRGQSDDNNKGAASRTDSIETEMRINKTGNEQVPVETIDVDYKVGPYPTVEEGTEGVDEGDGASR